MVYEFKMYLKRKNLTPEQWLQQTRAKTIDDARQIMLMHKLRPDEKILAELFPAKIIQKESLRKKKKLNVNKKLDKEVEDFKDVENIATAKSSSFNTEFDNFLPSIELFK